MDLDVPSVLRCCFWCNRKFFLTEVILESLESDHDYGEVVERLLASRVLHQRVNHPTAHLVDGQAPLRGVLTILGLTLFDGLPSHLLHLEVGHAVENAIAAHHHEVLVLIRRGLRCLFLGRGVTATCCSSTYRELRDLRLRNNYSRLAPILLCLGLDIPERARYTEPPGKDYIAKLMNQLP